MLASPARYAQRRPNEAALATNAVGPDAEVIALAPYTGFGET
jgi:hypothetical protein